MAIRLMHVSSAAIQLLDNNKYYLGSICKRGHDYNNTGKSLRRNNDNHCLECNKLANLKHRENNPEKERERRKKYRDKNKEKIKENARIYYDTNKENIKQQKKIYRVINRNKNRKYCQEYYHKNKITQRFRRNEYRKKQFKNNTQAAIRQRLRVIARRALQEYTKTGKIMSSEKYGIDYGAIIAHLGPHPNIIRLKGFWEIDHIIPLSRFDLNDPEQIKLAFAPENHQWLRARENRSKGNKLGQLDFVTQKQLEAIIPKAETFAGSSSAS